MAEMNNRNLHLLDNVINQIREINNTLNHIENGELIYIGTTILIELCKKSGNIECGRYDLFEKPTIIYNLRKDNLEELIGRIFVKVLPYSQAHPSVLEAKVRETINEGIPYENLKKSEIEIEKLTYNMLKGTYQSAGAKILGKLEEIGIIKVIKIGEQENPPLYITILDKAYQYIEEYKKRVMDTLEYEYKIDEYD